MKVSYNWLQEYIEVPLPQVSETVEALTMHSFEIEGVESKNGDSILDVKVLPNRSHDCLSHYGIASEIASVLNLQRKPLLPQVTLEKTEKVNVIFDTKFCDRAVMVYINEVKVSESPEWLKEKLQLLGQKPINNIVDITNYLTLFFGQPMHAFDALKLTPNKKGNIDMVIRQAKSGEKLILLNGKEVTLDNTMMVISNNGIARDVAGVMGGKDTGVDEKTTDIILSLSHFNAVSVRKTAKQLGLRTDASHRFENDISDALIDRVLPYALEFISEIADSEIVGGMDLNPKPRKEVVVSVTKEKIESVLGTEIETQNVIGLLARQNILATATGSNISVSVPPERLDLEIPENIAEEVGRLYGYDNILPKELPGTTVPVVNPENYVSNTIRVVLSQLGFSEVYTYSLRQGGDVEIENPLASDKNFLRSCLIDGIEESLNHNFKYADLLGIKEVKVFEIGKVFTKKGEFLHLAIGVKYPKSKKGIEPDEEIAKVIQEIEKTLGVSIGNLSIMSGIVEFDLARILKDVAVPQKYPEELFSVLGNEVEYKAISPYPFAVRDVAVFVPVTVSVNNVYDLIQKHVNQNVVRLSLFDTFQKATETGSKTSYAFRLIFQSAEKTLTDEEINAVMNPIYEDLKAQTGFEIR